MTDTADPTTNIHALNAFIDEKAAIEKLLARMRSALDEHFNVAPGQIDWGHADSLNFVHAKLSEIVERLGSRR